MGRGWKAAFPCKRKGVEESAMVGEIGDTKVLKIVKETSSATDSCRWDEPG